MEYINYIKAKTHLATASKSEKPVLTEEDEQFLNRITSEGNPRPFSPHGAVPHDGDAQLALMDGAQNIALPPDTPGDSVDSHTDRQAEEFPGTLTTGTEKKTDEKKGRPRWTWLRRDSRETAKANRETAATGLHDIAQGLKAADAKPNENGLVEPDEAKKEEEDMTVVLESLNLAAVNNRVFSISDETQDLLQQFNQVFKDLINGVPTAYDDLESLLTNGDRQLQKTYNSMPPFLQKLIEKLPETLTKSFGPEIAAAAAERGSQSGMNLANAGKAAALASKVLKTPSLKDLVAKPTAITGMLRSIVTFLKTRFPAFMGMNVLWSLAMFVLLFVFWYCYKRGREVRLEKERELTEQELSRLDVEYRSLHPSTRTTTAPIGASMEDVQAGMQEVEAARFVATTAVTTDEPKTALSDVPVDKVDVVPQTHAGTSTPK